MKEGLLEMIKNRNISNDQGKRRGDSLVLPATIEMTGYSETISVLQNEGLVVET